MSTSSRLARFALALSLLCDGRGATAPRPAQPQRRSTSCAMLPRNPPRGLSSTSSLPVPGWLRWNRCAPIPRSPTAPSRPTIGCRTSSMFTTRLNDNIDTFVERKSDLRKPLKAIIEADTEFQAKLRALKSSFDREQRRG